MYVEWTAKIAQVTLAIQSMQVVIMEAKRVIICMVSWQKSWTHTKHREYYLRCSQPICAKNRSVVAFECAQ